MREIKFRAWDKEDKRIKYFNTYHDTFSFGNKGIARYYNLQNGSGGNEYILMQYTGLKDKNGKEIYEGDIVQHDFMKAKIVYGYCGFELEWVTPRVATIRNRKKEPIFSNISLIFEVIGNIYENPELLEG